MLDVLLRLMTNVVLGSIGPRKIFAGPWPIGVLQKICFFFFRAQFFLRWGEQVINNYHWRVTEDALVVFG